MEEQVLIDDSEMPVAPVAGQETPQEAVEGAFDGSLLDAVPGMGDAIPVGTYHFRLDSFTEGWNEPTKDPKTGLAKNPDEVRFGKQPYFLLMWSCQQEPHTGRKVPEFCGWCTQEVFKAAASGDKTARKIVNNRLYVMKDILNGASFKSVGNLNFKDFLGTNPEMKLQLGLKASQTKDPATQKYINDGGQTNKILKHVSLTRPS